VTKTIVNISDRTQDVVRVTFSEPIQGPNGSQFTPATVKPQVVLTVYRLRPGTTDVYDTINTLSANLAPNGIDSLTIKSFSRVVNDSTLEFIMSNGKDLTTADFININVGPNQIFDGRSRTGGGVGVPPVVNNQKVAVKVINAAPNKIIAVPNPSGPIFTRPGEAPGNFSFVNNPFALTWVREDQAGTAIVFDLSPPKSAGEWINATIKIFDAIGNVVNTADTVITYNKIQDTTTTIKYTAYWNGSNSSGLRAAPGVYATSVYLTYSSATKPKQLVKLWGIIGLSH
jgi:hypothetical protein